MWMTSIYEMWSLSASWLCSILSFANMKSFGPCQFSPSIMEPTWHKYYVCQVPDALFIIFFTLYFLCGSLSSPILQVHWITPFECGWALWHRQVWIEVQILCCIITPKAGEVGIVTSLLGWKSWLLSQLSLIPTWLLLLVVMVVVVGWGL